MADATEGSGPTTTHIVIWPQYLDASLLPRHGRRLPFNQSVLHPTIDEMFEALQMLGYGQNCYVDPVKSYPRAQSQAYCIPPLRGCLKVQLRQQAVGECVVPGIDKKATLLSAIAALIAANPDRKAVAVGRAQMMAASHAEATANMMAIEGPKETRKVRRAGGK
jgi:signal recognition particle subunit SEC65